MDRPTCRTCPYWLLMDDHYGEERLSDVPLCGEITVAEHEELYPNDDMIGDCLRFPGPPRVEIHRSVDGGHASSGTMVQLLVPKRLEKYDFDWCGEHPDFPAYLKARSAEPKAAEQATS
jgi:hypothetical protein